MEERIKMRTSIKKIEGKEYIQTDILGREKIVKEIKEKVMYPKCDFGFGKVNFLPEYAQSILNLLNNFFMKHRKTGDIRGNILSLFVGITHFLSLGIILIMKEKKHGKRI